jgi:hypothetical protein
VTVRQPDGAAVDVTAEVSGTTLPAALVEAWSTRLDRTLVSFEVHT